MSLTLNHRALLNALEPTLRRCLSKLPAETSHDWAIQLLKLSTRLRLTQPALLHHPVTVMGIPFINPVGLAAGFDKNGEAIDALGAMGFGFIEIGTVTPKPQPGNPKPRLFRLPKERAIINRMGFNNKGVDYLIEQVKRSRYQQRGGVLGINIGKNLTTPVERGRR